MRLTDKEFFSNCLDPTIPEFSVFPALCREDKQESYAECKKIFAAYVRAHLAPEKLFSTLILKGKDVWTKRFEFHVKNAMRNNLESCGIYHDFGKGPIDWEFNPTANHYEEWPWQLNRHWEMTVLSKAYRITKEKKYADACAEMISGWIGTMPSPSPGTSPYATWGWRTIECGIRMCDAWPEVIHSLAWEFSDGLLCDIFKSVWEHGTRLRHDHVDIGNWLMMEMDGLIHVAVLYPWLRESAEWLSYSLEKFSEMCDAQIYPDGFQYELTTSYQHVTLTNFLRPLKLCKAYGIPGCEKLQEVLRGIFLFYVRLMRPDGRVPSINDGMYMKTKDVLALSEGLYDDEPAFLWALGRSEKEPTETDFVSEYAGLAALRTGWGKDDRFLFFDGGEFGVAHQHEDKLSLLYSIGGKNILTEGGNYAYDSSELRKYVLSSFSHNTAVIDGMGQNRKKEYKWCGDITRKSGLRYSLSEDVCALRAVYDEGYGETCVRCVRHERSVYFVRKFKTVKPFLVVADRFFATDQKEHDIEILWSLDAEQLSYNKSGVFADGVCLAVARESGSALSVCRGQTFPSLRGWVANSTVQGDVRPVFCVTEKLCGRDLRTVTVLCDGEGLSGLPLVLASNDVSEKEIRVRFASGEEFVLWEAEL